MIKNLNDFLSFIVSCVLVFSSFRVFISAFVTKESNERMKVSKWRLLKDYNDNIEE